MKKGLIWIFLLAACIATRGQAPSEKLIDEGIELHEEKKYTEAIAKYEEALKLDPTSWRAHYEMAFSYYASKDYENAIVHAEESIKNDKNNAYYSYVVLGSAYDLINKPKKAIKTYEKGIKRFPKMYLLHYNLGLTHYNLNDLKDAEDHVVKAIKLNPNHASSHLLLAYMTNKQGERSKTILSLYYFLTLEADSPRSKDALHLLKQLQKKGVTKRDDKNVDIVLTMDDNKDFEASDLMLSLLQAANHSEENNDKSAEELFFENTKSFFTILGELNEKKKRKDFWEDFYVSHFYRLIEDGHCEALSYYVQMSSEEKPIMLWLELNGKKIEEFDDWFEKNNR